MPEKLADKTVFTLYEVNRSIQKTLAARYTSSFWVKAEMNKLNYYKHSGHCYPELVEKSDGRVIAQIKAILWNDDYLKINKRFIEILKESLKDGIKILFLAKITFDPSHGLSLRIIDIDASFTLGDLQKEKQLTIERLKSEGIFNKNKLLQLPLLPQRIALISVESSKGYADFIKVIEGNNWNYKFFHFLFPSILQGEKAVDGIILQLQRIRKIINHFDVVAIIRGGGGDVGLSCFNNYELAKEISIFPLPVFTGIGHATNETVVEMAAHTNGITPTKVAELLLQHFHNFSIPVQKAQEKIIEQSNRSLREQNTALASFAKLFRSISNNIVAFNKNILKENETFLHQSLRSILKEELTNLKAISKSLSKDFFFYCNIEKNEITHLEKELANKTRLKIIQLKNNLEMTEKNVRILQPENVLKRGYSITYKNGKILKNQAEVSEGDEIHSRLFSGEIISIVQKIN